MILQALYRYYQRIEASGNVALEGYAPTQISFEIVFNKAGAVIDVRSKREERNKKLVPSLIILPAVQRSSGIKPAFLWDKTAYTLGASAHSKRAGDEFEAFKTYHLKLLEKAKSEELIAFCAFLNSWQSENFTNLPHHEELLDSNVIFKLDGQTHSLHECQEAREIWANEQNGDGEASSQGFCLVTGENAPIAKLHRVIKGVPGAQPAGAALISFNADAYESFNRKDGDIAPVSKRAVHGYATALNHLLSNNLGIDEKTKRKIYTNRVQIGDATTVFFAEGLGGVQDVDKEEDFFQFMFDPPPPKDEEEAARILEKLEHLAEGKAIEALDPALHPETKFYILGLSPNAARLSIRFFFETTLGKLATRMREHWQDLRLEPRDTPKPPALWMLLRETAAQGKADNVSPFLAGEMTRAIFTGARYPRALYMQLLQRIRADGEINHRRVSMLKACLTRDFRLGFEQEETPMALDIDELNIGYRLGRLFAVLESVQINAIEKLNATIKDKYFSSASANPARVFPVLIRGGQNHISSMRKMDSKKGLSYWFDERIVEIMNGVDAATPFPSTLRLEDQGRFAVGYYHERRRPKKEGVIDDAKIETEEE